VAKKTKKKRHAGKRPAAPAVRSGAKPPLYRQRAFLSLGAVIVAAVIAAVVAVVATRGGGGASGASSGLPDTPDYHSLSVSPEDASSILLGTHYGLYHSSDGGKTWVARGLAGKDAMNLARPSGQTLWTAGHYVLAKSTDGGRSWSDVHPAGLPSLDIHGFAVDPRRPSTLYAAVAGRGLYRSNDKGVSFRPVSRDVGGAVMALAVKPTGEILAGDMQRGLLLSRDGGRTWRVVLRAQLLGLAINPENPKRLLAAGPGILFSSDGGQKWSQPLKIDQGAGPVAWAPGNAKIAYAVGFDRRFYRSADGGETWSAVG
jgi:photosystem II stability/assembly factor-like uncharacterized protein